MRAKNDKICQDAARGVVFHYSECFHVTVRHFSRLNRALTIRICLRCSECMGKERERCKEASGRARRCGLSGLHG